MINENLTFVFNLCYLFNLFNLILFILIFQWAWQMGQLSRGQKVRVPLHGCEHSYVITRPLPGITKDLPS